MARTWPLDPANGELPVFKGVLKKLGASGVITGIVAGDEAGFGEGVEGDDKGDKGDEDDKGFGVHIYQFNIAIAVISTTLSFPRRQGSISI